MTHSGRLAAARRWLAVAAVGAQLAYPLVGGVARQHLAAVVVLLWAAAVVAHAGRSAGWLLLVAGGGGLAVELCGVHTGEPFGAYAYTGHLGPRVAGVPLVVALAWVMLAWPALCVARRLATRYAARVAVGAVALASYDLLLDPQLVAAGGWRWATGTPALQGIPLHDDLGWLLVSALLVAVLERVCGPVADDRLPVALWVWLWLGSVLADLVFLQLPAAALVGGLAMAVVGVPLLLRHRVRAVTA